MSAQEICPICGEGHVTLSQQMLEYEYKGKKTKLHSYYKQCDTCTSDFAGMAESKRNKRIVMAFRKQVDGLLTGEEIVALRQQYELTQVQATKLFGGGPVAFSKYENDDVAQSESMDTLLRLVRRSSVAFRELVEEKGLKAEFTKQPAPAQAVLKVIVSSTSKMQPDRPDPRYDPRYDPRAFRQYEDGVLSCTQ